MNPSTSAAVALVGELVRQGLSHVVLAPGSRSAPLAFAVAAAADRGDLCLHVRIDERSAAFTAVGLARAGELAAVVTTSGTAVANLHPAVLEASHAAIPLVLLTADRPHEARGTGANQTTDQVRIFGPAARFFADVPAPSGRPGEDADVRNLLGRAVAAARGTRNGHPGPVHLNLAFREPLVPDAMPIGDDVSRAGTGTRAPGATDVRAAAPSPLDGVRTLTLDPGPRTVVIAGDGAGPAARRFAEKAGFPLLAEPSSGARGGPLATGAYRLLLERPELGGRVQRVVVFGHPTLSRPVSALMARRDVEVVVVSPTGGWPDAARNAAYVVPAVEPVHGGDDVDDDWCGAWLAASDAAGTALDQVLASAPLSGPAVARELWAALRPADALVVASSNPIRDLDLVAGPSPDPDPLIVANRGLSGIDGTISTASGVALATRRFTRALVGDLAFLHDVGGLLVGPLEKEPELQVVVANDAGGGIFGLLEQGAPAYESVFERIFGTPHRADLSALCAGYGVAHKCVDDLDGLRGELAEPRPGRSVIEVRVDRSGLRELHGRLRAAVDEALTPLGW